MKLFYKLVIMLLLLTCMAPFFIKGSDNRPLMTLGKLKLVNFSMPQLPSLSALKLPAVSTRGNTAIPAVAEKIKIYKWKDRDGSWHFSDHKNPDGPYEVLYLPAGDNLAGPNDYTNSIGDIKTSIQNNLSEIHAKLPSAKGPLSMPLSSAVELMQEAQQVQKQIEENYKAQSVLLK
jgi:hypothetical protein